MMRQWGLSVGKRYTRVRRAPRALLSSHRSATAAAATRRLFSTKDESNNNDDGLPGVLSQEYKEHLRTLVASMDAPKQGEGKQEGNLNLAGKLTRKQRLDAMAKHNADVVLAKLEHKYGKDATEEYVLSKSTPSVKLQEGEVYLPMDADEENPISHKFEDFTKDEMTELLRQYTLVQGQKKFDKFRRSLTVGPDFEVSDELVGVNTSSEDMSTSDWDHELHDDRFVEYMNESESDVSPAYVYYKMKEGSKVGAKVDDAALLDLLDESDDNQSVAYGQKNPILKVTDKEAEKLENLMLGDEKKGKDGQPLTEEQLHLRQFLIDTEGKQIDYAKVLHEFEACYQFALGEARAQGQDSVSYADIVAAKKVMPKQVHLSRKQRRKIKARMEVEGSDFEFSDSDVARAMEGASDFEDVDHDALGESGSDSDANVHRVAANASKSNGGEDSDRGKGAAAAESDDDNGVGVDPSLAAEYPLPSGSDTEAMMWNALETGGWRNLEYVLENNPEFADRYYAKDNEIAQNDFQQRVDPHCLDSTPVPIPNIPDGDPVTDRLQDLIYKMHVLDPVENHPRALSKKFKLRLVHIRAILKLKAITNRMDKSGIMDSYKSNEQIAMAMEHDPEFRPYWGEWDKLVAKHGTPPAPIWDNSDRNFKWAMQLEDLEEEQESFLEQNDSDSQFDSDDSDAEYESAKGLVGKDKEAALAEERQHKLNETRVMMETVWEEMEKERVRAFPKWMRKEHKIEPIPFEERFTEARVEELVQQAVDMEDLEKKAFFGENSEEADMNNPAHNYHAYERRLRADTFPASATFASGPEWTQTDISAFSEDETNDEESEMEPDMDQEKAMRTGLDQIDEYRPPEAKDFDALNDFSHPKYDLPQADTRMIKNEEHHKMMEENRQIMERFMNRQERLAEVEKAQYARDGPIGSDTPASEVKLLDERVQSPNHYNITLTDISDGKNRNYAIAVRDTAGRLREPFPREFGRVKELEQGYKFARFNYIEWKPLDDYHQVAKKSKQ